MSVQFSFFKDKIKKEGGLMSKKLTISVGIMLLMAMEFAWSAQFALVTSEKATIYADINMTAPIGFLSKGKKLKVGEVPRNQGKLLPVIINKKIAYIKIDDLALSYSPERLEMIAQKKLRRDDKKNHYQFSMQYKIQNATMVTSETIGGAKEKTLNFTGFGLKGHIDSKNSKEQFRIGIDYLTGSDGDDEKFRVFTLSPELFYGFFTSEKFNLGLIGALYLSPYAQYELTPLFKVNGTGYGFGAGLASFWNLSPDYKIELNYIFQNMNYTGYNLPDGISVDSIAPNISGNMISLGLNYSY
jgi:hypothetical protein